MAALDTPEFSQIPRGLLDCILDLHPAAILLLDSEGRVRALNGVAKRLLGYQDAVARGKSLDELIFLSTEFSEDGRVPFPIRDFIEQNQRIEKLDCALLKLGDGKKSEVSLSLLPFEETNHRGAVLMIEERTRPSVLEPQGLRSQEVLELFFENFEGGVTLNQWVRGEQGVPLEFVIVAANSGFGKMAGHEVAQLLHKRSREVFGGSTSAFLDQLIKLDQGESRVHFETYFWPWQRYLEITAFALDSDRFFAVFNDLTPYKSAGTALGQSIPVFQTLVQTVRDGIVVVDLQGRIQFWNKAAERIFGYSSKEALGRVVDELIIPPEWQAWADGNWKRFVESAKLGSEGMTFEFECLTKSGVRVPVEVSLSLATVEERWLGVAVIRDISERCQAERAIERRDAVLTGISFAAERLLQTEDWQEVIQNILEALGTATGVDRVSLFKNLGGLDEGGVSLAPVCEWVAKGSLPQNDHLASQLRLLRGGGFARWVEKLRSGEPLYGRVEEFPELEQEFLRSQGMLSLAVFPVFVGERWWGVMKFDDCHSSRFWSQSEIEALCIAVNLIGSAIHRQEMSQKIQQTERRYRDLVERLPVVVYVAVANEQGALQAEYVSPNIEQLCGYTSQEILSDPYLWIQRIHPEDRPEALEVYRRHLSERRPWDQEYRLIRKDGETVWVRDQAIPLYDSRRNLLVAQGLIQDISLNKRRQREQQAIQLVHWALQGNDKLDTLLERLLEAVIHAVPGAQKGSVLLQDESGGGLSIRALYGYRDPRILQISFPLERGYSAKAFRLRQPLIIGDARGDPTIRFDGEVEEMRAVQSAIVAPLMIHDRAIGVIALDNCERRNAFTAEDLHFLSSIASTAALVVENVRLLDEARNRVRELELIADLSFSLRMANSQKEVIEVLLEKVLRGLHLSSIGVRLFDPGGEKAVLEAVRGSAETLADFFRVLGEEQVQLLCEKRVSVLVFDEPTCAENGFSGCRSVAGMSLVAKDQVIGELFLCGQWKFSEQDQYLLKAIADIAAGALHRAKLYEQAEKQLRHLVSLYAIERAITERHDLKTILQTVAQEARSQLGVDALAIHLFDPQANRLSFVASDGFHTEYVKETDLSLGKGVMGKAASEKRAIYTPNLHLADAPIARTKLCREERFIAHHVIPLVIQGQLKGVLEVFHRTEFDPPAEWRALFEAFADQAAVAIDNAQLFEDLQRTNVQLAAAYDATLEGWAKALEQRDRETLGHSNRVTELTLRIASEMGVPQDQMVHIWRGVRLHDIGKMAIPDQILQKPGPLSESEWEIMRRHPVYAYELLSPIEYLRPALDIPYCHHEWWDGRGYPRGLKGEEIPLAARIFAVVDVWDALTSNRPYRPAWTPEKALQYIHEQRGKQFDPAVVDVFLRIIREQMGKG